MKTRQHIPSKKANSTARQGVLPGCHPPRTDYELLILPGTERVRPGLPAALYSAGGGIIDPAPCRCGHMALLERSSRVRTLEDFNAFLNELIINLREHPEGWSTTPLESFLAGLARLVERGESNSPVLRDVSWHKLALLFMAAKGYRG